MIRYCPTCWAENAYEASVCTSCGAALDETGKKYSDRLIDAIGHPEPTRAALAAEILGRLRERGAVDSLLARLACKPDSMDVTASIAKALGLIGEQRAVPGLVTVLQDGERQLPARMAAAEALVDLGGATAREALATTAVLPQLPHLLRRVIDSALLDDFSPPEPGLSGLVHDSPQAVLPNDHRGSV